MNIGNEIKRLRIENGWSQDELALRINRKKGTISQYELGKREPDFETINRLAEIFGVPTGHFFGSKHELKSTGYENKEDFVNALLTLLVKQGKIEKFEDLTENQRKMIEAAISQQIEEINKSRD